MKKPISILLFLAVMTGCATAPIPKGYSGPIATFRDTAMSESNNRAQFFYLSEIDGHRIDNALFATRTANYGRGFSLSVVSYARNVPAKTLSLKLEGKIGYGAPIQELLNSATVFTVERVVSFTPEPNKTYTVNGILTADKQEVWIEDADALQASVAKNLVEHHEEKLAQLGGSDCNDTPESDPGEIHFRRGKELTALGQYGAAMHCFLRAQDEAGDTYIYRESCVSIATMYELGEGVGKNLETAKTWLKKAGL